ncbi:chromosome partitioning protein ParB [Natronobacterium gregoryi SP2]|nr:hypothetical protein C490_09343 [Natronobacterium gregoryi SP2]PLK18492.1 chromosome partitioning protein ParB [Natronobacterium gregoryi SP2]
MQRLLEHVRATFLSGISILQNEGLRPFIQAGLRELNLNHRGFYYYLNYLYKQSHGSYRTAEPFTIVNTDPQRIRYRAPRDIDRWKHVGEVRDGNWDYSSRTLEDSVKYRSVVDRFENGTPWKETDIYQETLERLENGETHWNGCRTVDDLERRIDHVERLYETIRKSGFKSQSELHSESVKSIVLSGAFDRSKTDVAVAVGRDGEFLFVDGNHRLAIAHVLGLEDMPVRVVVRHARWQNIREEITSADSKDELSDDAVRSLSHPDVRSVVDQNEF